jgi:hypothetical protein
MGWGGITDKQAGECHIPSSGEKTVEKRFGFLPELSQIPRDLVQRIKRRVT